MAEFTADQLARQARYEAAKASGQIPSSGRSTSQGQQAPIASGGGASDIQQRYEDYKAFALQQTAPSAFETRGQGLSSVASPYAEVLKTMPRGGGNGVFSYEYYTYDQVSKSQAATIGFYRNQPLAQQQLWEQAGAELGRSGHSLYNDYVEFSAFRGGEGVMVSPWELLMNDLATGSAQLKDPNGSGSGSYGGGGGGSTVVLSNREDARSVIDTLALQMIGRTVNDKEFENYFSALGAAERANPTTVSMEGSTAVQQSGMTAAGREQVLKDELRLNDDFAEFQVGGQMVGMFQQYLNEKGVFNG